MMTHSLLLKNKYICRLISEVVVIGIAVYILPAVNHSYCEVASIVSDLNMGYHFIFGLITKGCFINCWSNDLAIGHSLASWHKT